MDPTRQPPILWIVPDDRSANLSTGRIEVVFGPTAEAAAELVARIVAWEFQANPLLVLGLATGSTMEAVYARLVRLHREQGLDFSRCRTFDLDEYVGLPPTHRNAYRRYMNEHLFQQMNIESPHTHLPDGTARDLNAECVQYERSIAQCGGITMITHLDGIDPDAISTCLRSVHGRAGSTVARITGAGEGG